MIISADVLSRATMLYRPTGYGDAYCCWYDWPGPCSLSSRESVLDSLRRVLHSRTLLVLEAALRVRTLWVALSTIAVLRCAINLLRLRWVLVAYWRELRARAHLWWHHVLLILWCLRLRLTGVLPVPRGLLALAFVFLLALVVLFLLLGFPVLADLFELYERMRQQGSASACSHARGA